MRIRCLIPALSLCLAASLPVAVAQPKDAPKGADPKKGTDPKADPKKGPAPTGKDAPPGTGAGAGAGAGGAGTGGEVVQMSEDAPPGDIEGRDENPDAPKIVGNEPAPAIEKPAAPRPTGYPMEEAMRPLTLPRNMSEVAIGPHMQFDPVMASDALRARYGITDKIQLGLTYVLAGIYDDPNSASDKVGVHAGKAVGLDVTVALKDWVAARFGLPFYIDPFAISVALSTPMKWQLAGGKYAIGALDDLLTIRIKRFAPSFYQEAANAVAASGTDSMGSNTIQSRGELRFSAYGIMQYQPKLAIIGRLGIVMQDFATTKTDAGEDNSGLKSFMRAGVQYTVRKYLDLGISLGFDDLSELGSFGPAGLLAFRI